MASTSGSFENGPEGRAAWSDSTGRLNAGSHHGREISTRSLHYHQENLSKAHI